MRHPGTEERTVGDLIREARRKRGLTQTQLAGMMYTTTQSVQRWERGRVDPKASTLRRLCQTLDIEPNYLFGYASNIEDHPRLKYYRDKVEQIRRAVL